MLPLNQKKHQKYVDAEKIHHKQSGAQLRIQGYQQRQYDQKTAHADQHRMVTRQPIEQSSDRPLKPQQKRNEDKQANEGQHTIPLHQSPSTTVLISAPFRENPYCSYRA